MSKSKIHIQSIKVLVSIFIVLLSCCDRKKEMQLKIKDQAKEYVVLSGMITNEVKTHSLSITKSGNYLNHEGKALTDAIFEMRSSFGKENFILNGSEYVFLGNIYPFTEYTFTCTYKTEKYSYSFITPLHPLIDTVLLSQVGNDYTMNVRLFQPVTFLSCLAKLFKGNVSAQNDTIWEDYNASVLNGYKIEFINPLLVKTNLDFSVPTINISDNLTLQKGSLLKLELYAIDGLTTKYLLEIASSNNQRFDPLALSPPTRCFAFSNQALGVVIPGIKSQYLLVVP